MRPKAVQITLTSRIHVSNPDLGHSHGERHARTQLHADSCRAVSSWALQNIRQGGLCPGWLGEQGAWRQIYGYTWCVRVCVCVCVCWKDSSPSDQQGTPPSSPDLWLLQCSQPQRTRLLPGVMPAPWFSQPLRQGDGWGQRSSRPRCPPPP